MHYYPLKSFTMSALFCALLVFPLHSLGQPDREAYLWKQGMLQIVKRGLNACDASTVNVELYLKFAKIAHKDAAYKFRDYADYKEITLVEFRVAAERFEEAVRHYKKAIVTFASAYKQYKKAGASASRSTDATLSRYRQIVKRQFKDATTIYNEAKDWIVLGNRAFNAGNKYFNQAVDKAFLRKDKEDTEDLKKRLKFHRWPAPH